jgi:phenylalanyl-tRNA synthetase beta chain
MKVPYDHLVHFIPSEPSIDLLSEKLFQLGHEHEIHAGIFDFELTPNRGDCFSVKGLLRDLAAFFDVRLNTEKYSGDINPLKIDFTNKVPNACPHISFLKINIEGDIRPYKGLFKKYFDDLDIKKINFFTDISNYISYETGQPTHCYDAKKITNPISLEILDEEYEFETLIDKKIKLNNKNLVFIQDNSVINLAGIMGGRNSACTNNTNSVIIECAYFNPENIIGQSIRYDIKSDAAHKFERGVDPLCHEDTLRRFLKIVDEHSTIKSIEIFKKDYQNFDSTQLVFSVERVNSILGTSLNNKKFEDYLLKLGFRIEDNKVIIPSYRSDIVNENDIAEEIARVIGYNNISAQSIKFPKLSNKLEDYELLENKYKSLKNFLINNGFFEVINNPFLNYETKESIKVDNPLDSKRKNIRTDLKRSLIDNLLYNERRQQDSIKLFEISDVYYLEKELIKNERRLGIICSGRVGNNYLDFSKKIDIKYLKKILNKAFIEMDFEPEIINRAGLDTKINTKIIYVEIKLDHLKTLKSEILNNSQSILNKNNFIKYRPISTFPSSVRDLSFAVKDKGKYYELQESLLNYKNNLIKEIFVFDFYNNEARDEIKIGFRFIFQSNSSTITESEVSSIMNQIIDIALSIPSVEIPGLVR